MRYGDRLLLSGRLVFGRYFDDAVGIDVEGYLNLRCAARRRCNTGQFKSPQGFIVGRHFPFTLQHMYRHCRLIVGGSGEYFAFFSRDGGIFINQFGHYTTYGFNSERQGGHVEQQNIFHVAL